MINKETRFVGSFTAVDDSGVVHTIDVHQTFMVSGDLDGNRSERPGLKEFSIGGRPVNEIGPGEYQTLSGVKLRMVEKPATGNAAK